MRSMSQNCKIQLQRNRRQDGGHGLAGNMSGMEDNEFTLACLELFHMKPGGIHSWHLPAPYFRHGMLVSATAGSTKVTFNALEQNPS